MIYAHGVLTLGEEDLKMHSQRFSKDGYWTDQFKSYHGLLTMASEFAISVVYVDEGGFAVVKNRWGHALPYTPFCT